MPGTMYASTDFESYNIDQNLNSIFDDILGKIMYVNFNMYGVQTLPSDSLDPVELNLLIESGNYKIEFYVNGPNGIKISPIFITVGKEGDEYFQFIPYMMDVYYRSGKMNEGGVVNWKQWEASFNDKCPIYTGDMEPVDVPTSFALWIDTTIKGFPVIKGYKPDYGWFGVGSLIDVMYASTYDTENRFRDAFLYLESILGMILFKPDGSYEILDYDYEKVTAYSLRERYTRHLDLGHMTIEEREYFENTIDKTEFESMMEEYRKEFEAYVKERVTGNIPALDAQMKSNKTNLRDHRKVEYAHTTLEMADYWNEKSDSDHQHLSDYNVRVDASQIVSGIIDADRLPSTIIERLVHVKTHQDRFELRTFDVQNGDSVYVDEENDKYEKGLYLVIDMYQLNNDKGWLFYRVRKMSNIDFEDIGKLPSDFNGYGITNGTISIKDTANPTNPGKFPEFVYPYKTDDGSFNYMLYTKVQSFYKKFETVLWHIEDSLKNYDIHPMEVFMGWNSENLYTVDSKWKPYATIEGNLVPVQHELNVEKHGIVEERYARAFEMMY